MLQISLRQEEVTFHTLGVNLNRVLAVGDSLLPFLLFQVAQRAVCVKRTRARILDLKER
jgi:hypothetical protein